MDRRCLYRMANRKRNPWFALVRKVLFRVAFAGFIVLEFAVFMLFLLAISWAIPAISKVAPEDNSFFLGSLLALILIGPFAVGASSYLIFQRLTRAEYVAAESERWLAERQRLDARRIKRRNRFRRWAIWIPTVTVILVCVFFNQTVALTSHMLHPGSTRIIGYRIAIPLSWTVGYSAPYQTADQKWSYVTATKDTGKLSAGLEVYFGRDPHLVVSEMAFYGAAGEQIEVGRHSPFGYDDKIISSHEVPFGRGVITCSDYASQNVQEPGYREIDCNTLKGDFFCFFSGREEYVSQFYQTLQTVRPSE